MQYVFKKSMKGSYPVLLNNTIIYQILLYFLVPRLYLVKYTIYTCIHRIRPIRDFYAKDLLNFRLV